MADAQPGSEEDAAREVPVTRFWRSLIAVLKENREVFKSFPEMIESLIENEEHIAKMTEAHKREEYRAFVEETLMTKDKEMKAVIKQLKEVENENMALKTELEMKNKEVTESEEKTSVEKTFKKEDEEMKALIKQLKDVENENLALKTELEKKNKEVTESEEKLSSKESEMKNMFDQYCKELDKHKSRNMALKTELEKKNKEVTESEEKNNSLKNEIEAQEDTIKQYSQRMSQAKDDLKAAYTKMEGYKSRLASLSDKRVKQDQRLVEDTLGSNRQSELERDFSAFFDGDRMDACEKMQSIYLNKEDDFIYLYYPRLACIIFETAYEQAKEVKEAASYLFKEFTNIMIHHAADMGTDLCAKRKLYMHGKCGNQMCSFPINVALWGERSDYPKEVMDGMTLSLKEAAHICNLDSLVQDVSNITFVKWKEWYEKDTTCMFSPAWNIIEGLEKYIKASIRLTWRMVTQVPPMKLEYHCSKFKKDLHRNVSIVSAGTHSSAQPDQEEEIACYLWPGLQDGGGRRIRPGEVLCKVTKQRR